MDYKELKEKLLALPHGDRTVICIKAGKSPHYLDALLYGKGQIKSPSVDTFEKLVEQYELHMKGVA